ncbi:hypothetical protein FS842_008633 [Serendipita sp. 407]|nr:hypothetical protein FS842_008633 [Serendipita sp. 407]
MPMNVWTLQAKVKRDFRRLQTNRSDRSTSKGTEWGKDAEISGSGTRKLMKEPRNMGRRRRGGYWYKQYWVQHTVFRNTVRPILDQFQHR